MNLPCKIWIVDDDRSIRWVLEKALSAEGLYTEAFETADSLLSRLSKDTPDAIISDIRMPGTDGLQMLERIQETHPEVPIIIMTAHSDLESAVASYQGGAFEYLPKPFDVDDAVALAKRALAHAIEQRQQVAEQVLEDSTEIIGEAPAMQEVFRAIGRLSQSNITVLINGESGTGKELVAHALHKHSPRRDRPFIPLNMAAIPHDLIESELFGHEKVLSRALRLHVVDVLNKPMVVRSFSMRLVICLRMRKRDCCEYWPTASFIVSVGIRRLKWMCALLQQPIRI